MSLLLPDHFGRFLSEVYFRDFNPLRPAGLSRHTVAHGVAHPNDFSRQRALLGLLILDQLSYFLAGSSVATERDGSPQ